MRVHLCCGALVLWCCGVLVVRAGRARSACDSAVLLAKCLAFFQSNFDMNLAANAPPVRRLADFTYLEGLAGMLEALRTIPRNQGRHGGYLTRYAGEVECLRAREGAGRLDHDDMVRSQRMLATVATTAATLMLSVSGCHLQPRSMYCKRTCPARAAGDAQRARALRIACRVYTTCALTTSGVVTGGDLVGAR